MLLEGKTAVIYGAAGSIGSAVARAFAREGAVVHLAGRTEATLAAVAELIRAEGGTAFLASVDALDQEAVERHAAEVARGANIDICFNAISNDDIQGTPLLDMRFDDFLLPVTKSVTAHFHIATAVGRHMSRAGRGVILVMAGGREAIPLLGGAHVAWTALVGLCRQFAAELGPRGVRVAWLLSPGSTEDSADAEPAAQLSAREAEPSASWTEAAPGTTGLMPRHQPSYAEVAHAAAFAASDWARTMTAAEINLTGGAVVD